jgi:hypothetical protein
VAVPTEIACTMQASYTQHDLRSTNSARLLILVRRAGHKLNLPHMTERRSPQRLPDSSLVMISWVENGVRFDQLGSAKNSSTGGVGVLMNRALPVGSVVTVSSSTGETAGIVRHNSELIEGHIIGIEFYR